MFWCLEILYRFTRVIENQGHAKDEKQHLQCVLVERLTAFWATLESFLQLPFQGVPGQDDAHNEVIPHFQVYVLAAAPNWEDLTSYRDTGNAPFMWERHSHNAFSTAWMIYIGSRKSCMVNSRSHCGRKAQTMWRNFWGFSSPQP